LVLHLIFKGGIQMQIEKINNTENVNIGFVQYFKNEVIDKITYSYDGNCVVHYHNEPHKELRIGCDFYNSQYGIPISADGKKLFIGSWDKGFGGFKRGIQAYDIETGSVIWNFPKGRIRQVFIYDDYAVALKSCEAIFKFDIDSGEVIGQVKAATVDAIFDTGTKYVFTEGLKLIDTQKMVIEKKYNSKIVDPLGYVFCIEEASLKGNTLTISGFERPPNTAYDVIDPRGIPFERVIDTDINA